MGCDAMPYLNLYFEALVWHWDGTGRGSGRDRVDWEKVYNAECYERSIDDSPEMETSSLRFENLVHQ
jgi:hypothetical protein